MERIQEALRKARSERAMNRVVKATPAATLTEDPWSKLASFTPTAAHLKRKRVIVPGSGAPQVSIDILRTRLLQQMRKAGWTKLMVTSPRGGCGKSMTCVNLAISIARQKEMKVLLLDFDLRKPSLANIFGYRGASGMASVLEGRKNFHDTAVRIDTNLAVCMGPEISANPAESLLSPHTHDLIAQLEADYSPDLMIFDVPPIYANDDTAALATSVDCALAIIAAEETKLAEIDSCERDLAAITQVAGLVINKCRYSEPGQGSSDEYY